MINNKRKYDLNSNPMSISLTKPTQLININNIISSDIELDEIFTKKYAQFLNGKKMFILQDYLYQR